jgi:transposase-like protein
MAERSIPVYHATMHRWIVRYSLELLERFNHRKRSVSRYPKTFAVMDIVIPPREW